MSVGRKLNDGDFGSFNFEFGVETAVPPGVDTMEFMTDIYSGLSHKLRETLIGEGIVSEGE